MDKNVKTKLKKGYNYINDQESPTDIEESINEMQN